LAVQCLNEALCFVFSSLVADSFVLRNLQLLVDAKRYATLLLESGTDLRYIQELLGHNSSKTTEIHTHVSTKSLQQIKSPFDDL